MAGHIFLAWTLPRLILCNDIEAKDNDICDTEKVQFIWENHCGFGKNRYNQIIAKPESLYPELTVYVPITFSLVSRGTSLQGDFYNRAAVDMAGTRNVV